MTTIGMTLTKGVNQIKAIHTTKNVVMFFVSKAEASKVLGCNRGSITHILNGKRKRSKNWTFEYMGVASE